MKIRNYINIFLIITWMFVIFNFSNQTGTSSSGLSSKIIIGIAEIFNKDLTTKEKEEIVDKYKLIVRKGAHFGTYFILGTLTIILFIDLKGTTKLSFIISTLICTIYAATDEIHQLFIPGRCGSIIDVLIDSCGSLTAIIIIFTIASLIKKNKSTNK